MNIRRRLVALLFLLVVAGTAEAGEGTAVIVAVAGGAGGEVSTAQADAQAIQDLLTDAAGFAPARTFLMTDDSPGRDRPTSANIKERIDEAAGKAGPGDRLLVYFAGRASAGKEDVTLLPGPGAGREGVSLAWVVRTLAKSAAASKAVILDLSCGDEEAGAVREAALKAAPDEAKVATALATGSKTVWVTVDGEASQRSSFSATVAKALSGKADIDGDWVVTMHELELFLRSDLVQRRARGEAGYDLLTVGGKRTDARVELAKLKAPELDPEEAKAAEEAFKRGPGRTRAEQAKWYSEAIRRSPGRAGLYYDRGFQYFGLGRNQEAYMDWTECLEIDPRHSWAWNMRGNLLVGWRLYDEAMADLNKATEIEPDLPLPYNHRGRVYSAQGKLDLAVENFSKGIELLDKEGRPDDEWLLVHLGRAKAYYRLKEYDKAWADVKFCREKNIPVPADFVRNLEEASGKDEGE